MFNALISDPAEKNYIRRQQQKHLMHVLNVFKVNGKITRTVILFHLKTSKNHSFFVSGGIEWHYSGVFIVNFEHIQNIDLLILSLL